jgi:adenosylhomocysteine nucleosidase
MATAEPDETARVARPAVDVLAVAAEPREFAGLLARTARKRRLRGWGLACAWQVELGERRWVLVADGAGSALARHAAETALGHVAPLVVVSTGLCGALRAGLRVGDIVCAGEIVRADGTAAACAMAEAAAPVRLLTLDRVIVTVGEKRRLAASSGAGVVEMEAAGVAEAARAAGVEFYCLRVVSDTADEGLPLDFNSYRDRAGRFSRGRVAAACLGRPWVIPALLRFDARCREAGEKLGAYLVDARFA